MATYSTDRSWSDKMIPQIKEIVGPYLLDITPDEIDTKQAADLMILGARDMRIAARVRRLGYAERYPYEFTLRSRRDSGAETELSKVINGLGDWMFYGHADNADKIGLWWLINLCAFRAALIRDAKSIRFKKQDNGDGTYFVAYDLRSFPKTPSILIGSSSRIDSVAA